MESEKEIRKEYEYEEEVYKKYMPQLERLIKIIVEKSVSSPVSDHMNDEKRMRTLKAIGFLNSHIYRIFSQKFNLEFKEDMMLVGICGVAGITVLRDLYPLVLNETWHSIFEKILDSIKLTVLNSLKNSDKEREMILL